MLRLTRWTIAHRRIVVVSWIVLTFGLYALSNQRAEYENGFEIAEINAEPEHEFIKFSNGRVLRLHEEMGGMRDDVWRRRKWLRFACLRNQSWICVDEAAATKMPALETIA